MAHPSETLLHIPSHWYVAIYYFVQSEDIMDLKLAQCQKEIDKYTAIIATNKLQLKELSDQFENIATEYSKSHTPEALGGITESTWALVR